MKFSEALDRQLEEIKTPPPLPVGHYIWQISKHPEITEFEGRDGTAYERLTFPLTCIEPGDDVDPDELAEYGNVQGAFNRKAFLITNGTEADVERGLAQIKGFLKRIGIDEEGMTLSEALAASVGTQFLGEVTHRPDKNDPEVIYAEVGRVAALG